MRTFFAAAVLFAGSVCAGAEVFDYPDCRI